MSLLNDRPSRFLSWAHEMFGDVAFDHGERTMRFLEEAVELAQAMALTRGTVEAIVARVYGRPPGVAAAEMGQAMVTLELLGKATGVDLDAEATKEFRRVQTIPKQEWQRRHTAKTKTGITARTHSES